MSLQRERKHNVHVCLWCLCVSACVRERERERERETQSLSKLIRRGIRIEVKYWATCNERSRVGDIQGSGPHQTVVLGQSGIDFHSFEDKGGRGAGNHGERQKERKGEKQRSGV